MPSAVARVDGREAVADERVQQRRLARLHPARERDAQRLAHPDPQLLHRGRGLWVTGVRGRRYLHERRDRAGSPESVTSPLR